MLLKVKEAKYIKDYKIEILFNNGVKSIVDLKDSINGVVFKPLQNIEYFKQFTKNRWTIEWECNADFAPEYLYDLAIKKSK